MASTTTSTTLTTSSTPTALTTPSPLHGKRIVLLGGTSGIGLATATAAAREGASVVVVSSNRARVDRALTALPAGNEGHAVDLSDEPSVRRFFDALGPFDHLVFTAGESLKLGPLASTDLTEARRFFDLRYWGTFMAARHGAPHLRPGGSIVLTGGIASLRPHPGWTLGASICGAMEALTRALAVELAPVRVNLVSPGVVRTPLWDSMPDDARTSLYRDTAASLPVGRVGEPDDIAETYLYLMRQRFSTGQTVVVDGGAVLV
ncbi:SDR family oxidoreductase [Chondromyces apiculatus]|uniref:3-oxoacyl-[acyl-carrier protein] reductase n=1 Tax=Chondromyces apiculatus DSM 436 TaxID=1192034 RepID=A0A017T7Q2_9BACT|nr:SDR family oxidoreductase [Chondromyces apiculatus]EYF04997.1 3-oxoacyl-[acyl-carrier protein] reductase [Chondromyces apiculatus DSM 436]